MQPNNTGKHYRKNPSYTLTKKMLNGIGLIAQNEEFKRCPTEKTLWVSNYGRLISTRRGNPVLLKTSFYKGYQKINLRYINYGKEINVDYFVHRLVATLFVEKGKWIYPEDKLIVHHISPVDPDNPDKRKDYACNLMWVPEKLHRAIHRINQIEVFTNSGWQATDFETASEQLSIDPYRFFSICGTKSKRNLPLRIDAEGWEYFSTAVERADQEEENNLFRIQRQINNKKSDN